LVVVALGAARIIAGYAARGRNSVGTEFADCVGFGGFGGGFLFVGVAFGLGWCWLYVSGGKGILDGSARIEASRGR